MKTTARVIVAVVAVLAAATAAHLSLSTAEINGVDRGPESLPGGAPWDLASITGGYPLDDGAICLHEGLEELAYGPIFLPGGVRSAYGPIFLPGGVRSAYGPIFLPGGVRSAYGPIFLPGGVRLA